MAALPKSSLVPTIDFATRWDGGIADLTKNAPEVEYGMGRSFDVRSDPYHPTIFGRTIKESGGIVNDLVKDGDRVQTDLYEYGESGNIYKRTSDGSVNLVHAVAASHGNGMKYYAEDDYLYYTTDKAIGRFGQIINGNPSWTDDFLAAEGGIPQNTNALHLASASSQYADRADTTSLSITGDLAIEAWINPDSLPSVGNSMVIFSKWDIASNKRSYKFEILGVSAYFGDGSAGSLTVSLSTTWSPIDAACTGTSTQQTLAATNVSFAAGQVILVHQTQGANAGQWERNKISGYATGTITLDTPLLGTYAGGAQVLVLPQYTSVTVNSGVVYSAKTWNGTTGGILAFLANGTVTINGTISAVNAGFRGGIGVSSFDERGWFGEGTAGASFQQAVQAPNNLANGNGGGAPSFNNSNIARTGGAGSNGTQGGAGTQWSAGGDIVGNSALTNMNLGGAGGGGVRAPGVGSGAGTGATGGGIIFLTSATLNVSGTGTLTTNGSIGGADGNNHQADGGSSAGGSILLKSQTATFTGTTTAVGGAATPSGANQGGDGRIHLDYFTSFTGTTAPTLDATQDNTLVTNTTYQLRVGLSSTGTNEEFLTKSAMLTTDSYAHIAMSWNSTGHVAEFFQNGASLGTTTGSLTAIFNSTSNAAIGADFNTTARNFYNGLIDEVRIWNIQRSEDDVKSNMSFYVDPTTPGLVAWYKCNGNYDDATSNANHLGGENSPTFSTTVAFSGATDRQDLDQSLDTSGNTYTILSAISESAANRQTFVPQKDPQKSIQVLVANIGTGDWTLTIHDPQNRVVAVVTITHANMHTGDVEFVFSSVWRPVRGATYHFHLTTTTGDGTVTTTTSSDMETVDFHTFYQFLVEDTQYHQLEQIENILAICNERYLATYSASGGYNPHRLVFPAGWRARCLAIWKGTIAIGCTKGDAMTDTDEGAIFFWDGNADTYTDYIPIAEGGVNAMKTYKGLLYLVAGYRGEIPVYDGADSTNDDLKKHIPGLNPDEYIEVMPKAMTVWQGLLRIGVSGTSNAVDVQRGVYTYGRKLAESPVALTFDYPISTGTLASTNMRVGFLYPIATKMVVGWEDSVNHGTDIVDPAALPFASASLERTINDFSRVSKQKQALKIRAEFDALPEGASLKLKYRFDRATDWTYGNVVNTVGLQTASLSIDKGQHREIEYGIDFAISGTAAPGLLELGLKEDLKISEGAY